MNFDTTLQNIHLTINPLGLWAIFFAGLIIFAISSMVYIYHWQSYGTSQTFVQRIEILYVAVGVMLLVINAGLILFH